jgi:hypothetical protein
MEAVELPDTVLFVHGQYTAPAESDNLTGRRKWESTEFGLAFIRVRRSIATGNARLDNF